MQLQLSRGILATIHDGVADARVFIYFKLH